MKAALIRRRITPPKTHNLIQLSRLLAKAVSDWEWDQEELRFLNSGAVVLRYPDAFATYDEAKRAMKLCRKLRARLLALV